MDTYTAAFVTVAVVLAIEVILSGTFSSVYFRFGLPVYTKRISTTDRALPAFEARIEQESSGGLMSPFVFRRLSPTEVAFRERAFGFRLFSYTPVMHGLVRLVPEEGAAYIIGWLNWFVAVFSISVIFFVVTMSFDSMFLAFLGGLILLIYLVQSRRYRGVGQRIWPRAV